MGAGRPLPHDSGNPGRTMGLFLFPLKDPSFCEDRGRHGPFVNREIYLHLPGWEEMADCAMCGSTVPLPRDMTDLRPDRRGHGDR